MSHTPTAHFLRHYAEMVVAMLLGMLVLELTPWDPQEPELLLLGMATAMTIPMVAWMRYRGHGWRASWEMTLAMFVPTLGALALGWTGVLDGAHAQMGVQHVVMFPAMLLVMLLRRDEYTGRAQSAARMTDARRPPASARSSSPSALKESRSSPAPPPEA